MKNRVPNENCLTEVQLLKYLRDECLPNEEKAIDRHLTHCPLCSDALEGAMLLNVPRLERSLKHLDAKIETQYSDKTAAAKPLRVVDEPTMTVVKKPNRRWLWAAAGVAALAVAGVGVLTKPMDYGVASPTVVEAAPNVLSTSDSTLTQTQTVNSETKVKPNNTELNRAKSNNGADSPPTVADIYTEPPTLPAPVTIPSNQAEGESAPVSTVKPNYTEGVATIEKEMKVKTDDAKSEEVVDANIVKKAKAQTRQVQPTPSSATQNYPGAAAQNSAASYKQVADDGLADYQTAMRFYNKGAYNDAVASFNRTLSKQPNSFVLQNAQWFLANSYLKLNKQQEARTLLQRIASENGKYATQAASLLK